MKKKKLHLLPVGNLDHLTPPERDAVKNILLFAREQLNAPNGIGPAVRAYWFTPPAYKYYPMPWHNVDEKIRMVREIKTLIRAIDPQPALTIALSEAWTLPADFALAEHKRQRRIPMPSEHAERIEVVMISVETPTTIITGTSEIKTSVEKGKFVRFIESVRWFPVVTATSSDFELAGTMTGFLFHAKPRKLPQHRR